MRAQRVTPHQHFLQEAVQAAWYHTASIASPHTQTITVQIQAPGLFLDHERGTSVELEAQQGFWPGGAPAVEDCSSATAKLVTS